MFLRFGRDWDITREHAICTREPGLYIKIFRIIARDHDKLLSIKGIGEYTAVQLRLLHSIFHIRPLMAMYTG
jgi:hypothetical protein